MIKSIKKVIWKSLNLLGLGGAIQLMLESGLKDDGWFYSYHNKKSVDPAGKSLPWFTYSFIKFISPRLRKEFDVYEYGSGNSTIWFSEKVHSVTSVEHNLEWYNSVKKSTPSNSWLYYKSIENGSEYEDQLLEEKKIFDIIVIDGRKRVKCTVNSIKKLKPSGVIIFDNSERKEYEEAMLILKKEGFKRLDFWGLGPIIHHNTCTSVFYKTDNCLNI